MTRVLLGVIAALPVLASADLRRDPYAALDFALHLGEHHIPLAYGATDVGTTTQRISVDWGEHYGERLRLGLLGGYSFVTQTGNTATAGLELDGYHVRASFDLDLVRRPPFTLYLAGGYLYERAKHDGATQSVVLSWSEPSSRLGASVMVGDKLRLSAGAHHGYIEGQERRHGSVNQTTDIERRHATGGFVGVELTVDADAGYVGITGQSAPERGAAIYFGRRF